MDKSEAGFEEQIEEHLVAIHGYRHRFGGKKRNGKHYNRIQGLDWELLLEFITSTQAETWKALQAQHKERTGV